MRYSKAFSQKGVRDETKIKSTLNVGVQSAKISFLNSFYNKNFFLSSL